MKTQVQWAKAGYFLITGILLLIWPAKAARADEEYNFSWLDPDKKIYVLQNRRYQKAKHIMLSVTGGLGNASAYRNTINIEPRASYYFSEAFGFEAFFNYNFNSENDTLDALRNAVGSTPVLPVIRQVASQAGLLFVWAPWYSKINVFNSILYFDWFFTLGAGMTNTEVETRNSFAADSNLVKESLFSIFWGTGHQYHVNEWFKVRVDFTASHYRAPIFGITGDETWFDNYNFNIGVGFQL
ncbi:MAG: hypothetical protein CL678_03805 [Bdellovibrionaceae bacterium]|nr:hypothetical protein [Pseudobdellovibrionaceae bacterium]|tara:strand:- start:5071 stop:5793 length:723 start_codon:yes stop_codon:yes gene_type:complete